MTNCSPAPQMLRQREHRECYATMRDESITWTCKLPRGHEGPHQDDWYGAVTRWSDGPGVA
jgi:hypothetical protein